jgi:hypothetical protein
MLEIVGEEVLYLYRASEREFQYEINSFPRLGREGANRNLTFLKERPRRSKTRPNQFDISHFSCDLAKSPRDCE